MFTEAIESDSIICIGITEPPTERKIKIELPKARPYWQEKLQRLHWKA
ncbi:hypothetical protein SLEP1_g35018 [Rubroshorea leprosula]|uniref:Uncharacterized protein n=1 Tax=Rubroshorea leprosula TaxID=152421 RepID=A0AAV5KM64_9ROSI|nr:hypothetical protein SLEP1_g35018 [Rubroshorea leprosula]